ncbi:MAG: hypothetical protein UHW60_06460 [Methanobrevibacter sp.]|nr:hypothetical protein [Methanobrevibacter sp.]MEE3490514.1 hypothetical protein [Methanobrevibacter sp.]
MILEGVEKTMLLTIYTKAKHSKEKNHKFYDEKAIEVISKIDYDFSMAEKDKLMQMGVIGRTIVLDDMVGEYIKMHPDCTIVNIASGWTPVSTGLTTAGSDGTMWIWKIPQTSD